MWWMNISYLISMCEFLQLFLGMSENGVNTNYILFKTEKNVHVVWWCFKSYLAAKWFFMKISLLHRWKWSLPSSEKYHTWGTEGSKAMDHSSKPSDQVNITLSARKMIEVTGIYWSSPYILERRKNCRCHI